MQYSIFRKYVQKWNGSIGKSNPLNGYYHPTQKPVELLERIILASTKPGDLILEPFMGSGTTGVAALKHGRLFVGIDQEPQFVELAEKRLYDISEKKDKK